MANTACLDMPAGSGDHALISAYLDGNEYALELLVHRYQDKLVRYLCNLIHDYELAMDLAQEAFIRVYRHADRYEGRYQFSTWLYRIATNLAIDEIRRRQRRGQRFFHSVTALFQGDAVSSHLADVRQCPEKALNRKEKVRLLERAIDSLPEKYRVAFVLKEVQELSYEEAAEILELSVGTVKSRIHRAKLLLREKLAGVL